MGITIFFYNDILTYLLDTLILVNTVMTEMKSLEMVALLLVLLRVDTFV